MTAQTIQTYRFPTTSDLDVPLFTSTLTRAESMTWDQVPDRHTFYALFWILDGAGGHHIDFERYPIRPNSLFLMRPGQTHFFEVEQPIHAYNLFFKEDWLHLDPQSRQASKLFSLVEQQPAYYPTGQQADSLTQALQQLQVEYKSAEIGRSQALHILFQLILLHVQRIYHQSHPAGKLESETRLSSEFYRLLGEHFTTIHRVGDYADMLGVSTTYLNRNVKSATGIPASHLIRQRRLIEAQRLLVHTDLSVGEIARQVGFEDRSYFGRFFKRETKLTPVHFRRYWFEKYQNSLA